MNVCNISARGCARVAVIAVLMVNAAWSQEQARPTAPAAPPPELNGPTIKTKQGKVQGFIANQVAVFRGLPFAAPPVGELRWREPKSPEKWQGIRAGNAYGGNCQQVEDCLYLNVYAPANATHKSKLPTMVWIHGGAFVFGSGAQYDGTKFAQQGVVVVTVNYRLGRAGWFAHPALTKENAKGGLANYGLMDQIAALRWVRDNIGEFGGDRNNVTAFGESAGAISINYLMLAPQARGLFHKAIAESGFGRLPPVPMRSADGRGAENFGVAFAEKNQITGSDAAAAKALRALTLQDLLKGVGGIGSVDAPLPMLDRKYIFTSASDGFAQGKQARVPYLVGGNSDEASLTRRGLKAAERLASIQNNRTDFLAAFDPDNSGNADRIIARLVTDESISEPDRALARAHSKRGMPTYVYHFSYVPISMRDQSFGLAHGGEIGYVFNNPRQGANWDDEAKAISVAANRYWTEFAKHSDPGSAGGPAWPQWIAGNESLIEFGFGGVPVVHKDFHRSRLDWVERSLGK